MDLRYRIWLLKYLAGVFLPPLALTFVTLRFVDESSLSYRVEGATRYALYFLSAPLYTIVSGYYKAWRDAASARRLRATISPVIQGKRIGNLDVLARFSRGIKTGYVGQIVSDLLDEAGVNTATMSIMGTKRILTRDHHIAKFIYKTGHDDFEKGYLTVLRNSIGGRGIFNVDGDAARAERSSALPYFAKTRISDYECIHKYTEKLVNILKDVAANQQAVEVQDIFMRVTFDTGGQFLFGADDLNTLDLPLPQPGKAGLGPRGISSEGSYGDYAEAFDQALVNLCYRATTPPVIWMASEFFNDRNAPVKKTLNDYYRPLIQRALERKEKREAGAVEDKEDISFLDHCVRATDDMEHVETQLGDFMAAARDTTAVVLSFTCYFLAMDPNVMSRLREEVLAHYGTQDIPTYDSLKKLKYLRAVIDETLRLFPPIPFMNRMSIKATVVPTDTGPLYVPAGEAILWSIIAIHRRKDFWGEDAEEYRPDRFLEPALMKALSTDPYHFVPFGGGPRICLGMQFGYNEASFMLARIVQAFDQFTLVQAEAAPAGSLPPAEWKNSTKGRLAKEKIHPMMAVTPYSKGGIWLKMRPAEN